MSLEEYRAKRYFKKTPEPKGELKDEGSHRFIVHSPQSCYVLQRKVPDVDQAMLRLHKVAKSSIDEYNLLTFKTKLYITQ